MAGITKRAIHTRHLSTLEGWTTAELFEAERAIGRLQDDPGWAVLMRLVEEQVETIQAELKYGPSLEQSEYTRKLGEIVGLEALSAAAEAVLICAQRVQAQLETNAETAGV